jgi:choline kinase
MKAVILAAGTATRLRPLTDHTPKCLLNVGTNTILGMTIDNLVANGVGEVVMVTGYLGHQICDFVGTHYPGLSVTFLTNERFAETNNIYSLWLTRRHLAGHAMLLLDSDIVFDPGIIALLQQSGHENGLAVLRGKELGNEEIKVRTDPAGAILEISKEVNPSTAFGESIGIEMFGPRFVAQLFDVLEQKIVLRNQVNQFYEAAFQEVIESGGRVFAVDVGGLPCLEIDTRDDLDAARMLVGRSTKTPAGSAPYSGSS